MIDYNGYVGTIEIDTDNDNLWGRVLNIADAIFYEGDTIAELRQSMHDALDNYLSHCEEIGKDPAKPFSGKIALRVDPLDHAKIAALAESCGVSMNQYIVDALRQRIAFAPGDIPSDLRLRTSGVMDHAAADLVVQALREAETLLRDRGNHGGRGPKPDTSAEPEPPASSPSAKATGTKRNRIAGTTNLDGKIRTTVTAPRRTAAKRAK